MTGKTTAEREIATAKAAIAKLLERKHEFDQVGYDLEQERAEISFAALAQDDPKAKKRLAEIHRASGEIASQAASLASALAEAQRRLAIGEQNLERERQRENAARVMELFATMKAEALRADAAARELADAYSKLETAHRQIVRLNCEVIGFATLWALTSRAIRWILHGLPPPIGEFQPPRDRLQLPAMLDSWERMYQSWAARRLDGDGPLDNDPDGDGAEPEPAELEAAE